MVLLRLDGHLVRLLGDVDTVQELQKMSTVRSGLKLAGAVFTFRISLFLTAQLPWMEAADCETSSIELPISHSVSFSFFGCSTVTPSAI